MASSKEFVGIAEGIKSRELSLSSSLERLRSTLSSLRSERVQLEHQIMSLQAEIAAAENEDEPDEGLIAALELQLEQAYTDLGNTEQEIVETESEVEETSIEYERVEEEKRQTLFEIQQRARTVAQSINAASGMFGAYATVGASLSQAFQSAFDALSKAAGILDGDVGSASASGSSSGGKSSGHGAGGGASSPSNPGPAAAIAGSGAIKKTIRAKGGLQSAQMSTRPVTSQILQTSLSTPTQPKSSAQSSLIDIQQTISAPNQAQANLQRFTSNELSSHKIPYPNKINATFKNSGLPLSAAAHMVNAGVSHTNSTHEEARSRTSLRKLTSDELSIHGTARTNRLKAALLKYGMILSVGISMTNASLSFAEATKKNVQVQTPVGSTIIATANAFRDLEDSLGEDDLAKGLEGEEPPILGSKINIVGPEPKPRIDIDRDKLRELLATKSGEAVFWSGTSGFEKPAGMTDAEYISMKKEFGGEKTAEMYARKHGRKTLEMKMRENRDALIALGIPIDSKTGEFSCDARMWEIMSEEFANGVSGDVFVIHGMDENTLREDENHNYREHNPIWHGKELTILEKNGTVHRITAVDPFSLEETVFIFQDGKLTEAEGAEKSEAKRQPSRLENMDNHKQIERTIETPHSSDTQSNVGEDRSKAFRESIRMTLTPEEVREYNRKNGIPDLVLERPKGGYERDYHGYDPRLDDEDED